MSEADAGCGTAAPSAGSSLDTEPDWSWATERETQGAAAASFLSDLLSGEADSFDVSSSRADTEDDTAAPRAALSGEALELSVAEAAAAATEVAGAEPNSDLLLAVQQAGVPAAPEWSA